MVFDFEFAAGSWHFLQAVEEPKINKYKQSLHLQPGFFYFTNAAKGDYLSWSQK